MMFREYRKGVFDVTAEQNLFVNAPFYTPPVRAAAFSAFIKSHSPSDCARILDVGCGAGDLVSELRKSFPMADIVGIDISVPNIARARKCSSRLSGAGKGVVFVLGDYLSLEVSKSDLLVSYSSLYLMPETVEVIADKMSSDLRPGGIAVFSIPNDCFYNRILVQFRRMIHIFQGPLADRIIFLLARALLGSDVSSDQIRQNILYMYVVPENLYNNCFRKALIKSGFSIELESGEAAESAFKLRHTAVVLKKLDG